MNIRKKEKKKVAMLKQGGGTLVNYTKKEMDTQKGMVIQKEVDTQKEMEKNEIFF